MDPTRKTHWSERANSYVADWLRSPIRFRIAEWLVSEVGRLPRPCVLLDVGSGPGQHSALIASRHQLLPIQIDANIEMLRRSTLSQSPRCQSLASELPFRSGSADVVIASLLLHHLGTVDQFRLLVEMRRVSKAGAAILFVDQFRPESVGTSEYDELVRRQFYPHLHPSQAVERFDPAKENPQSVAELARLISQAGFELLTGSTVGEVVWAATGRAIDCSNTNGG